MDQKQQIADRLKQANNILVTVSNNPSVDQLASCIGLTLALNKMSKHATAVFSGAVPSTIEFLQPEKTIEPNTDSLRDFIISLDKSKADKLRYKVEDKVVRIFITPYRTSISDKDLNFSQGDFNVDVVIALGVHNQTDLDQAITAHGRILHDATVATINTNPGGELGSLNWVEAGASSLSELVAELLDGMDRQLLDAQMATALLTGIVAETARFSNQKTSPVTMSISAQLMSAGANQQLVATKLEPPAPPPPPAPVPAQPAPAVPPQEGGATTQPPQPTKPPEGTIDAGQDNKPPTDLQTLSQEVEASKEEPVVPQIHIDEQGDLHNIEEIPLRPKEQPTTDPTQHLGSSRMVMQPPTMGGALSAGGMPDDGLASGDPLSLPRPDDPFAPPAGSGPSSPFAPPASATTASSPSAFMPPSMNPGSPVTPSPELSAPPVLATSTTPPPMQTLSDIEANVHSPHLAAAKPPATEPPANDSGIDTARNAVQQAIAAQPFNPDPIHALNAQPLGDRLHDQPAPPVDAGGIKPGAPDLLPKIDIPPPPVPPPMMPQQ